MVIIVANGISDSRVQILGEDVCVSHCANVPWKNMNTSVDPPAMGK